MLGVLTLLATLLFGFSVGGGASVEEESRAVAERPSAPAPSLPGRHRPPPAWVETERGSFWLASTGFCWGNGCVAMSLARLPRPIVVRRGEVVRFHLGFEPRRVMLSVGRKGQVRLEPARTTSWQVERGGVVSLDAYAVRGGPGKRVEYLTVFKLG